MSPRVVPSGATGGSPGTGEAGFFAGHTVASGWVSARATHPAQAAAAYQLCYYLGSSVGGSVGGLVFAEDGWLGVTMFTAALTLGMLALGLSLRKLVPARRLTPVTT